MDETIRLWDQQELMENWELCQSGKSPHKLEPLD